MAGIEVPLNIQFDKYLRSLSPTHIKRFLTDWVCLPNEALEPRLETPTIQSFVSIPGGEIDELISYSNQLGLAIELKDRWKTSPEQLKQYFNHTKDNFKLPYLLFLTRSPDDIAHRWIAPLFQDNRWVHRTWASLFTFLRNASGFTSLPSTKVFIDYLATNGLSSETRRPIKDYNLNVPLPQTYELDFSALSETQLPQGLSLGCWTYATHFWKDVLDSIFKQLGTFDFYSFRFDLYHYMFRWAYHERNVFFDMRKDNKWEYYYDYFVAHMEESFASAQCVTMSKLYYNYLKIGKNEFAPVGDFNIGVIRVNSKDCYFVARRGSNTVTLELLNLWEAIPW